MEGYEYVPKPNKPNIYIPVVNPSHNENLGMVPRIINDIFA